MKFHSGNIIKDQNDGKHIFVFGSNRQGRHGKGAALCASQYWGAIYGQAEGLQGQSYAIITKELRSFRKPVTLAEVGLGVNEFINFVLSHSELNFLISPLGCKLAGFMPNQIAPMFTKLTLQDNVYFPPEWKEYL